ncbi:TPA: hypothetical protein ACKQCJ_000351 [Stenotrophomonas maltophilia]|nr:hypothetical protein B7H26_04790 [Stenotrophomonas maltophilia]MBH1451063.1 hypothetical protein [Stenotrophomonas maltophilia]
MNELHTTRVQPDALTIAYIAIGARSALDELKSRDYNRVTGCDAGTGGELDLIDEVIRHALAMDTAADAVEDFSGVFLYEVAEPFGEAYVKALARGETPDAAAMIADLIASCS